MNANTEPFDFEEFCEYHSPPQFCGRLDNSDMKPFSVGVFYLFGSVVKAAADCVNIQQREEISKRLSDCKTYLEYYCKSPVATDQAVTEAERAVRSIDSSIHAMDAQKPLGDIALGQVAASLEAFSSVFRVEAASLDTYRVMPVGIFDTTKLIDHAEHAFSKEVIDNLEHLAVTDINQSGRCLAVQLWTACGFHALRAVECVARRYHKCVLGKEPAVRDATLGGAVAKLEECLPKDKTKIPSEDQNLELIISLMRRMNKMYRCPIMHRSELTLSEDQAKQAFDGAVILISAMVLDINDRNIIGGLFRHSTPNP